MEHGTEVSGEAQGYKGTFGIFFGIMHRMKKQVIGSQQTQKESPLRIQLVRIANTRKVEFLQQLTTILGAVIDQEENCRRRYAFFLPLLGTQKNRHREMRRCWKQWSSRRQPSGIPGWWLVMPTWTLKSYRRVCVSNQNCMFIEAPETRTSTSRSTGPTGELKLIETTHECVLSSRSLQGKIKNMVVVEDLRIKDAQGRYLLVDRDKEIQEVRELKMPSALPGYCGLKVPGRSEAKGGKEEEEEEDDVRRVEKEVMNAVFQANPVDCITSRVLAGRWRRRVGLEKFKRRVGRGTMSTSRSKAGTAHSGEPAAREDVVDWFMDDEMMRRWKKQAK